MCRSWPCPTSTCQDSSHHGIHGQKLAIVHRYVEVPAVTSWSLAGTNTYKYCIQDLKGMAYGYVEGSEYWQIQCKTYIGFRLWFEQRAGMAGSKRPAPISPEAQSPRSPRDIRWSGGLSAYRHLWAYHWLMGLLGEGQNLNSDQCSPSLTLSCWAPATHSSRKPYETNHIK